MINIDSVIIDKTMSIKSAMKKIEEGQCKTAFLLEDGILLGVITDGDIRRCLLNGGSIDDNICQIVNYDPKFFYESEKKEYQKFMIDNAIAAIPIVDHEMRLKRVECLNTYEEKKPKIEEDIPVVMMAGGMGTRLKPYTEIIPKPLFPIGNKTITEHIFDKFVSYGCNKFFMILNYKKDLIKAYFNEISKYKELKFVDEHFFMGTAGGIQLVKDQCDKNFFLVNCDILVDEDYYKIWREHVENDNIVTMVLAKKNITVPYGIIETNDNREVVGLIEKPQLAYHINTGMYLCSHQLFKYMDKNGESMDMPDLLIKCIKSGGKVGYVTIDENNWYDMGQPKELELMKQRMGIV